MSPRSLTDLLVRFWGARGSIPSPLPTHMRYGGNTSCVEVRYGEQLLILDAGSGIRLLGQELMERASGKELQGTLLLSHAHWDHIQGLPFFMPGYSGQNRFRIVSGPGKGAVLDEALRNQMSAPHFPVGFEQLRGFGPMAELNSGANKIAENDNWDATSGATFSGAGAFGLSPGSRDAALVTALLSGRSYTVQVKGSDGGTGVALVEIYELR